MELQSDVKLGFIGAGRMAQALGKGFIVNNLLGASNVMASDVDENALKFISKELGIQTTTDNNAVVDNSSVIFLAVKPHYVEPALNGVRGHVTAKHLFVSIAAGITIATLERLLPAGTRIVRVMPNTPALVGCGASVFTPNSAATAADCQLVSRLLSAVGTCDRVPEHQLDAVTALSGSGPAYGFLAIEALSDGGVKMGLPRDLAIKLAAQTLMGAAKMVLETGEHPGQLKDAVSSPGGCTISAIHELERGGFRASLISAVEASTKRCKEMGGS